MAESLQIQRISKAWQERLVDLEIERPDMSLGDIAKELGVTRSHLSVVRNSDAFIEYRALRMREHQDRLSHNVLEKTQRLTLLNLDVLHDRIEKEKEEIPLPLVKDITEMTLKSLGYGPKAQGPQVNVQVNNSQQQLSPEERHAFMEAREKLKFVNEHNTSRLQDVGIEKVEEAEVIVPSGEEIGNSSEHETPSETNFASDSDELLAAFEDDASSLDNTGGSE